MRYLLSSNNKYWVWYPKENSLLELTYINNRYISVVLNGKYKSTCSGGIVYFRLVELRKILKKCIKSSSNSSSWNFVNTEFNLNDIKPHIFLNTIK